MSYLLLLKAILGSGIPRFIIIFPPVLPGNAWWWDRCYTPVSQPICAVFFRFLHKLPCFPKHFGETLIDITNIHVFFNRSLVGESPLADRTLPNRNWAISELKSEVLAIWVLQGLNWWEIGLKRLGKGWFRHAWKRPRILSWNCGHQTWPKDIWYK